MSNRRFCNRKIQKIWNFCYYKCKSCLFFPERCYDTRHLNLPIENREVFNSVLIQFQTKGTLVLGLKTERWNDTCPLLDWEPQSLNSDDLKAWPESTQLLLPVTFSCWLVLNIANAPQMYQLLTLFNSHWTAFHRHGGKRNIS